MRGIEALRQMRRRGQVPQSVTLETTSDPWDLARDWHEHIPDHPQLFLDPAENVRRLDLRCLVGMFVWVTGADDKRIDDVVAACVKAGADRVIGSTWAKRGELCETTRMTDTKGWCTWPA